MVAVQRQNGIRRLRLAVSGIALACALLGPAFAQDAGVQDAGGQPLRGAIAPNGQSGNSDAAPAATEADGAASDAPGIGSDVIPQEEGADGQDTEEAAAERLRRKKQSESVAAGPEASLSGFGATANDTAARQKKQQTRKGNNVNQLADKKDKTTRAETVRGIKRLEKPRNTAVNTIGETPPPLGLTVSADDPKARKKKKKKSANSDDVDPYAPIGLRSGPLTLFPSASTAIGYDSNPLRRAKAVKGALFNRTAIGLRLDGDYGDTRLKGTIDASYDAYVNVSGANKPTIAANLSYEADIGETTTVESALKLGLNTTFSTDTTVPGAASRAKYDFNAGASLGVTERFGRTSLRLRGTVDRESASSAIRVAGTADPNTNGNATQLGLELRLGHEVSPGFQPFVEISGDKRLFDRALDATATRRGSQAVAAKAGFAYDIDDTIKGELSAGYGLRLFDDQRLKQLGGFVLAARLDFAATPLTTLTLGAESKIDDTTLTTTTGALARTVSIGIAHQLLRNLELKASLALEQNHPDSGGDDWTVRTGLGAEYRLFPELVLTGNYAYERKWAAKAVDSYDAHVLLFGVKVQR
jgi:hypothetical protein